MIMQLQQQQQHSHLPLSTNIGVNATNGVFSGAPRTTRTTSSTSTRMSGGPLPPRKRRMFWMSLIVPGLLVHWFALSYRLGKHTNECLTRAMRSPALELSRTASSSSSAATTGFASSSSMKVQQQIPPQAVDQWTTSPNDPNTTYHVIFSTGCSPWQEWQAYNFFYHAYHSGQRGHVTRIVSGCTPEMEKEVLAFHEKSVRPLSPNFHVHLTPEYANLKGPERHFKYFNKPFGVRHWMEHVLNYNSTTTRTSSNPAFDDHIIMLLDPDMILLRPLVHDFANEQEDWKPVNLSSKENEKPRIVQHGNPMAQRYGIGSAWRTFLNPQKLLPPASPVHWMTQEEDDAYYQIGPPYLATAKDMYKLAKKWTEVVYRAHDQNDDMLVEMYAYSLAAAHLNLRHMTAYTFMASNVHFDPSEYGEGWSFLDERYTDYQMCNPPNYHQQPQYHLQQPPRQPSFGSHIPLSDYPHTIHFCQSFALGKWFFNKHAIPSHFLTCEAPLLAEPPAIVASMYQHGVIPSDGSVITYEHHRKVQRTAFMLCHITRALNDAATYWKVHNCPTTENDNGRTNAATTTTTTADRANFDKTWTRHLDLADKSNNWTQPTTNTIRKSAVSPR